MIRSLAPARVTVVFAAFGALANVACGSISANLGSEPSREDSTATSDGGGNGGSGVGSSSPSGSSARADSGSDSTSGSAPGSDAGAPSPTDGGEPTDAHGADGGFVEGDGGGQGGGPVTCAELTRGWTAYKPTTTIQFQGAGDNNRYCTYRNTAGVELFKMEKNPDGIIQRCEARVHNDYNSGKNQFEGDVRVTAGNNTCVHQVFKFLMIVAYPQHGGEFHQHSVTPLASGVFGAWVHVNTVHDTKTHKADIYLDCVRKYTMADESATSSAGWYNKYGIYGIQGIPPLDATSQVEWKNVRYYRSP